MKFCVRLFIVFILLTSLCTFGMNKSNTFKASSKFFKYNLFNVSGNFSKNISKKAFFSTKNGSIANKNLTPKSYSQKTLIGRKYSTGKDFLSAELARERIAHFMTKALDQYEELIKKQDELYNHLVSVRNNNYNAEDLITLEQKTTSFLNATQEQRTIANALHELESIYGKSLLPMEDIEKKILPFQKTIADYKKEHINRYEDILKEYNALRVICAAAQPLVKAHFGTLLMKAIGENICKDTLNFVIQTGGSDMRAIIGNKVNYCKQAIDNILENNQDFINYCNAFYEKKYNELNQKNMNRQSFKNIAHFYIKYFINLYLKNNSEQFVDKLEGLINERLAYRALSPFEKFKRNTKSAVGNLYLQRASVWEKTKNMVKDFFKNTFNSK